MKFGTDMANFGAVNVQPSSIHFQSQNDSVSFGCGKDGACFGASKANTLAPILLKPAPAFGCGNKVDFTG